PENCKPATIAQAHAIQLATAERLDDPIVGWKVAKLPDGSLGRGALLRSRIYAEGASIPPKLVPLLGIEAEIAFRLDRGLPPRSTDYSYEEVAGAVTAMPAIEIVDSRLRGYPDSPLLDRLADCMSNGAFVHGPPIANWRSLDL